MIYDLDRGGPELRLLNFVSRFPKDLRLCIVTTSSNVALIREFEKWGVDVTVAPIRKIYLSIGQIFRISVHVKKKKISIMNVFDLKGLIIAEIIKILLNSKAKIIYHNVNSLVDLSTKQKYLLYLSFWFIDKVICNSLFSKQELKNFVGAKKLEVIYNGVDLGAFDQARKNARLLREKLKIGENEIVLGVVANFRKQKNYPFLIKAFEILSARHDNLNLLCVGGGPLLKDIVQMVTGRGLTEKVVFTGYTEDVVSYAGIFDILVLTSFWEGLPNAILEAMSLGIPVVSSDVGGCSEIITNMKNGILFPPNNQEKFVEAVEMLLNNKEFAFELGREGRKTVEEKFSLNRMIDDYAAFYRNM